MKVALVTGASRGIGRAIALQLAKDGYAIAVHYHQSESAAADVCKDILTIGGCAKSYGCDVADGSAVAAMIKEITSDFGPIDVLVNNAGIAQQKLFTDISDDEWRRMMAVHVDGAFFTCRACLPNMIRRHEGVIINVASMWGQIGASCEVHYSAAKAALIGLTKGLAKEVGPAGVRVNCVAPGVIRTDMLTTIDEQTKTELAEETPLGRLGTADDVAAAVSFLVSDKAAFITGQILAPNGGFVV